MRCGGREKETALRPGTTFAYGYGTAVGLGSLDEWAERCRVNRTVAQAYRRAASGYGVGERFFVGPDVASNYALLDAGSPNAADDVIAALQEQNIESRRLYGCGLHREPYLRDVQHEPLPVTDRIAPAILGLPISCDIAPTSRRPTSTERSRPHRALLRAATAPRYDMPEYSTDIPGAKAIAVGSTAAHCTQRAPCASQTDCAGKRFAKGIASNRSLISYGGTQTP